MEQVKELTLNRLPAITWRWLKVNDRTVQFPVEGIAASVKKELPDGLTASEDFAALSDIKTGGGIQVDALLDTSATEVYTLSGATEPMRFKFALEEGGSTRNRYGFVVEEGAEAVAVMDYKSAPDATGYAAVQTKILCKKNAKFTLVQIHRAGEEFVLVNDVGAVLEDRASLDIIHVVFSGKEVDLGAMAELRGTKAKANADVAYLVEKDHRLDMNYNFVLYGTETRGDIHANGVLRDHAFKTMRNTLDFRRGAKNASGDEAEDVMLVDDEIVNQSVPLILCTEEDVEGNHGASIGRLDDTLLFYLETRGIDKDSIYQMLAKARMEAVIKLIPDETTVTELVAYNNGEEPTA